MRRRYLLGAQMYLVCSYANARVYMHMCICMRWYVLRYVVYARAHKHAHAHTQQGTASCEHTMNTLRYANRVKQLKGDKAAGGAPNYNAYMPHQGAGIV